MVDLKDLIKKIEESRILLPDFQRSFVWSDLELQKRLLASVIAKLPIGSILLLEGDADEFNAKEIGRKGYLENIDSGSKLYLLDGQQRMTVLANAFSNSILKKGELSKLISMSLRTRYFLKLPAYDAFDDVNLFGLNELIFPFNPAGEPDFLAYQIYEQIVEESSVNHHVLNHDLDVNDYINDYSKDQIVNYCTKEKTPLIPLVLLASPGGDAVITRILKRIAHYREKHLASLVNNHFMKKTCDEYKMFVDSISNKRDKTLETIFYQEKEIAIKTLEELKEDWVTMMKDYLRNIIAYMNLSIIQVPKSQRARAIDIYENLNKGGVLLSTFDMVVAKSSQRNKINLTERIKSLLSTNDEFLELVPSNDFYNEGEYIFEKLGLFNTTRNEFSSIFINVFLNLLSIKVKSSETLDNRVQLIHIKRETILSLTANEINNNYKEVIKGIKRAISFMHYKLGIRRINDIKYEHVLLCIANHLIIDKWWTSQEALNKLEYWYWIVVFSGSYDKDQSKRMEGDINLLTQFLHSQINYEDTYFKNLRSQIFSDHYFTNIDILMMNQAKLNNIPKRVIRDLIVQYTLAQRPYDFINDNDGNKITLRSYDNVEKEIHHIIPLASSKNLGESSRELRSNETHFLNSPLNFTIISSKANKTILSEPLTSYISRVTNLASYNHFLPDKSVIKDLTDCDENRKKILELRYNSIKTSVDNTLKSLSGN